LLAALAEVGGPEFRDWLRTAVPFWPFLLIAIALYLLLTPRAVTGPGDKR
jgi:hypothetical protein